jgi:tetratricopeptide (TPR) repeat protein
VIDDKAWSKPWNCHWAKMPRFFIGFLTAALICTSVAAAERYEAFVNGLRDRQLYSTALDYLDRVEKTQTTPPEVREKIPYLRAVVLIDSAGAQPSLDDQRAQLDRAEVELTRFVSGSPNHALVPQANAERAGLTINRARLDIWDAADAQDPKRGEELRGRARDSLKKARVTIETAVKAQEKTWKSFPTLIPESDRAALAAREEAKDRYMKASLDAAQITYLESQTYDKDSIVRKKTIEAAIEQFEKLSQQFSHDLAGAYAIVWEGKCYEELGDMRKSLGLYDRIPQSDDPGNEQQERGAVHQLRDLALAFRLICLNSDQLKDHAVVVDEAEKWLHDHRDRARTPEGLNIEWQLCRALEALGQDRTRSENQRKGDSNSALEHARNVSRFPGEYKAQATRMTQRLMLALDKKSAEPKDFASAFAAASALYEQTISTSDSLREAQAKNDTRGAADLQRSLGATTDEMSRLLFKAIQLRGTNPDPEKLAMARFQLAYAYFLQGRYAACAALSEKQLRTDTAFPDLAKNAGALALSALENLINEHPKSSDVERGWQQAVADRIINSWPDSTQAQAAKMVLAHMAWVNGDMLKAAEWWLKIPPDSNQHAAAQISAGQAYWKQYLQAAQLPEGQRPTVDQLREWKMAASSNLERGINERSQALEDDAETPDDLVLGKLNLAQLRNLDGQFHTMGPSVGAIELLTAKPHDVISAVAAPIGGQRPDDPSKAQSPQVASVAYQQLLRSYIGVKDLDAARKARAELEEIAGASNPQALTAVYVEFGRELQRELDRLAAAGEKDRAAATRKGFEEFLTDLAGRVDGQSFSSMLWIAETLSGLAEAEGPKSEGLKKSAAIYTKMLQRSAEEGFLPSPAFKQVLRLHLAAIQRKEEDFEAAQQTIDSVLSESPGAPDVQLEAALLLTAWGQSQGAQGADKLQESISGRGGDLAIWGWGRTISRLQKEAATRPSDAINGLLLDAKYHLAEAELSLAKLTDDETSRDRHLDSARRAIYSFIRSTKSPQETDYQRFDQLYRQLLSELKEPIAGLPREPAALPTIAAKPNKAPASPQPDASTTAAANVDAPAGPRTSASLPKILGLIALGLLAVGSILYSSLKQISSKRERLAEIARRSGTKT